MITNIDKETLDFLVKKSLTFNQFCMCLMIHHQDVAGILRYTAEIGFLTGGTIKDTKGKEVNELQDLLNRGFLKHDERDKDDWYSLDNFMVTSKFTSAFLSNGDLLAKELWDAYPPLFIQGEEKASKAWDYEEYKTKYLGLIRNDKQLHSLIMGIVKTYRYAPMNLKNFVGSKHWENGTTEKNVTRIY